MSLELVSAEDVSSRKGRGKTKGEKYGKYATAIAPHVDWIKEEINKSKDGYIRMKTEDLVTEMKMKGKHETSVYWALKYVLFNEGIVVETGTHKDKSSMLIMRMGTEEDKLPPSLQKYVDAHTETEETEENDEIEKTGDED